MCSRCKGAASSGGVLKLVHREDLPRGVHIHESSTNSVTWPAMPCYLNLVVFDQLERVERTETIVPELAEKWKRGESVELVKNPDYFVKGRPYLDGIRFPIVVERGTRVAVS
jgi:ABC-type transport system substrate-binding protein